MVTLPTCLLRPSADQRSIPSISVDVGKRRCSLRKDDASSDGF